MGYSLAGNKLSESKKMTRIEVSKSPTVIMADVINERHLAENECLALKERAGPINSTRMHSGLLATHALRFKVRHKFASGLASDCINLEGS